MKYNLCDEQWILLVEGDSKTKAVGLKEAFLKANEFIGFGGEIRLQDTAMLRLFAAIAVTMIYRYNLSGNADYSTDETELLERYRRIYSQGHFPEAMVDAYFEKWHDRFYLIDEKYPFYQVPRSKLAVEVRNKGKKSEETLYGLPGRDGKIRFMNHKDISAMNGVILESGNKASAYADLSGKDKNSMTLAEAARWLVWYMAYADCGTKSPGKWASQMTFASMGANIYPTGRNLFETVMLSSVLINNGKQTYREVSPAWEREASLYAQDDPYGDAAPQNLPELYTQQSRRILLEGSDSEITSFYVIAGDKYAAVNAFIEPMFLWKTDQTDKSGMTMTTVKYNVNSTWNNLRNILLNSTTSRAVRWINLLQDQEIIDVENVPYMMTGITYGSMQSSVDKMLSDSFIAAPEFFEDTLKTDDMRKLIDVINNLSSAFYRYGCNLAVAEGADPSQNAKIRGRLVQEKLESTGEKTLREYLVNQIDKGEARKELIAACSNLVNEEMDKTSISAFSAKGDAKTAADYESIIRYEISKIMKEGGNE